MTCDRATEPHVQQIANRELVEIFANVMIPTAPSRLLHLSNHFSPGHSSQSLRTLHNNDAKKHQVDARHTGHRLSSRQCAQTSAAHQQRANVRSTAAGCQPHSFAGNAVALQPKAPCSKMPDHCVASRNMRFAEWRLCAQPPVASSAVSAVKARRLDAQRRSQRQPHHHSAKQATHSSTLEALGLKKCNID